MFFQIVRHCTSLEFIPTGVQLTCISSHITTVLTTGILLPINHQIHQMSLGFIYSFGSTVHLLNLASLIKGRGLNLLTTTTATLRRYPGGVRCYSLFRLFFLASIFLFSAGILVASGPSFLFAVDGPTAGSEGAAF